MTEPAPKVGDIWTHRFGERRVRVMRIWQGGSLALRTVALIGGEWQPKRGACGSTCKFGHFLSNFRLLKAAI